MGTFQADATAALTPLLSTYNLAYADVQPQGGPSFEVVAPPPPVPDPNFSLGFNVGGSWPTGSEINDTGFSLAQYLKDISAFSPYSGGYIRAWQTGSIESMPADSQFTQTRLWAAAGLKPIMVWNTQNATPTRCKAPTQSQVSAYFQGLPPASNTGIWAVELVNEHDSSIYYSDTDVNLAMIFKTAGPILKSKGYKVIASNALSSYGMYTDGVVKATLIPANVDYIGRHGYEGYAAASIADHTKVKAMADSLGLGYLSTETGLRSANYATELPTLLAGLKALGGIYVWFTLYQISGNSAYQYQNQPYTSPGVASANLAYMKKGLGL